MEQWCTDTDWVNPNLPTVNPVRCHSVLHKSIWCCTDNLTINHSRRCFPFTPATRSAAMRYGIWLAHLLTLRAITSAVRKRDVLLAFVQDLVHLQHWRSVALVYCAGRPLLQVRPAPVQATFWCLIVHVAWDQQETFWYIHCTMAYSLHYDIFTALWYIHCTMAYSLHYDIFTALSHIHRTIIFSLHYDIFTALWHIHSTMIYSLHYDIFTALWHIHYTMKYSLHYDIFTALWHIHCTMIYSLHYGIFSALWYILCTMIYSMHYNIFTALWHIQGTITVCSTVCVM
jgi:hypothetical protein